MKNLSMEFATNAGTSLVTSLIAYFVCYQVIQRMADSIQQAGAEIPVFTHWVLQLYPYFWFLSGLGAIAFILSRLDQRFAALSGRLAQLNGLLAIILSLASIFAVYLAVVWAPMSI